MPQEPVVSTTSSSPPYGIAPRHIEERSRGWGLSLIKLAVVGVPLAAALLGWLGGTAPTITRAASPSARLAVEAPAILRSGNWFEARVVVEPRVDIADLTIAIDQPLWRRMSIDTFAPDAEKAESKSGRFSYRFGPLPRGERFVLKLDGQIQPYGLRRLQGRVTVRDGERPLVSVPVSLVVLP
jgi:hypothetical protein